MQSSYAAVQGRGLLFRERAPKTSQDYTKFSTKTEKIKFLERKFRHEDNQIICSLDPLHVDKDISQVPLFNKHQELNQLIQLLEKMLPNRISVQTFTYYEAAAAMRDIGILLGSIKRHGVEPSQAVPSIEDILFILSEKLNMPPRDTLISYTIWNPIGERERTYTDHLDESQLILSVRTPMLSLESAIYDVEQLHHTSPFSHTFSEICEKAMTSFRPMIDGIVHAKRNVSPKIFAQELRHYYDAIKLRGKSYLGPGAVEMPLFVFEHLLWSCDNTDPAYKRFKEGYIPYVFPELRKFYYNYENQNSLTTIINNEIARHHGHDEVLLKSARSVVKLCNMLRSFRLPHKKLAASSYEGELAKREHGSGGYNIDTLDHIDQVMCQTVQEMKSNFENKSSCPVTH